MQDCREKLHERFDVYDTTVDIVSSWESFMSHVYEDEFDDFYFDRFPSLPSENDPKTPDFTVFFNEEYGIIAEIKRTFAQGERAFRAALDQLKGYDGNLPIKNANGDYIDPDVCDILVLISGTASPQIGTRMQRIIVEDEEYSYSRNPVLVRYQFNRLATVSRYEFQRETQLEFEFRDSALPEEDSLSANLGEQGDYGTMYGLPKHFIPEKVKKPICNDEPPGHYLATILWHKIFPEYLSEEQYLRWQQGTGQTTMEIEANIEDITDKFNSYMKRGSVNQTWIEDALHFLSVANLASDEGGSQYSISFRGLVQDVGEDHYQEGAQEFEQIRELATNFINRYCEYRENGEEDDSGQASLGRYIN